MKVIKLAAYISLVVIAAACGPAPTVTSQLSHEQATALAENALQALNTGDYAAWSRDWSDAMKAAIKEPAFQGFREGLLSDYGSYLGLAELELVKGASPGYVRWNALAQFERGRIRLAFGFKEDGTKVEGVFSEPVD